MKEKKSKNNNHKDETIKRLKPITSISHLCHICKEREITDEHHIGIDKKDEEKRNIHLENLSKEELKIYNQLKRIAKKKDPEVPTILICTVCHSKIHGTEVRRGKLRRLVVLLTRSQKARIAIDNQIRSFGRIELIVPEYMIKISEDLHNKEKELEKQIIGLLKSGDYKIYEWLKKVKGIGHLLSAKLISMIDIQKTPSPAHLWSFSGQTPDARRKKGVKNKFNPELKMYMFQVGDQFIKHRTPKYRDIYDEEKKKQLELMDNHSSEGTQRENETHVRYTTPPKNKSKLEGTQCGNENQCHSATPPNNLMHAHLRAMRKSVKSFLTDLYVEWRNIEGLEISKPYK